MPNTFTKHAMAEKKIILDYKGPIKFEMIEFLLNKVKKGMDSLGEKKIIKKKVFNLMVEIIENIYKHSANNEINNKDNIFQSRISLEKYENNYLITAGNTISNRNIESLRRRLDQVIQMNNKGLKILYEEKITKEPFSEKGGAGLGIITIAIKSDNKLNYSIISINDNFSYFELKVTILNKSKF